MLGHCAQARFGWNLALEQANSYGTAGRKASPNFAAQCRQLTEARAEHQWLAAGSQTVQQQARRDLDQAGRNFYGRTHRRPTWRKAGRHEGFRIVGGPAGRVRRLNRRWAEVGVPKVGWVRFRLSRAIPDAKSYRVTRDSAGRWHIAFAAIPAAIPPRAPPSCWYAAEGGCGSRRRSTCRHWTCCTGTATAGTRIPPPPPAD